MRLLSILNLLTRYLNKKYIMKPHTSNTNSGGKIPDINKKGQYQGQGMGSKPLHKPLTAKLYKEQHQ